MPRTEVRTEASRAAVLASKDAQKKNKKKKIGSELESESSSDSDAEKAAGIKSKRERRWRVLQMVFFPEPASSLSMSSARGSDGKANILRRLHCGGFSVRCNFISLNLTLSHC
jgi:hypothetical protein